MSKRFTTLIVILTLIGGMAQSQTSYRFTDSLNRWRTEYSTVDPDIRTTFGAAFYANDTVIQKQTYRQLHGEAGPLAVREDSAAGKIYCRFLSTKYRGVVTDAAEHVLFDYNLKTLDTFRVRYGAFFTAHVVRQISYVNFGTGRHRCWLMQKVRELGSSGIARDYTFIEGIGPTTMCTFSISATGFEEQYRLRCFTVGNSRLPCIPAIGIFDNNESCRYDLGLPFTAYGTRISMPNPADARSVLAMTNAAPGAVLTVVDYAGRTVVSRLPFAAGSAIPIGKHISLPGLYYYQILAANGDRIACGRFVFN